MEKIISEKLKSYKPKFQEEDWMAMEKLLDKKSKERLLLPWWRYGIAAACIIGLTVTGMVYQNSNNHKNSTIQSLVSNQEKTQHKISQEKKIQSLTNATKVAAKIEVQNSFQVQNKSAFSKNISKTNKLITLFSPSQLLPNAQSPLNENITTLNSLSKQELLSTNSMNIILDNIQESPFMEDKQSEVVLKKNSKKLLQFALGLDIGALANLQIKNTANSKSLNIYSDVFSDFGLNFQVNFKNIIGLYSGIKYADRKSFSSPDSISIGSNNTLLSSKSKIEGINIPIGIFVNLYYQRFLNLYTKIGINNIIPIKESISFETIDKTLLTPLENTTSIGNTKLVSSNDNSVSVDKSNVSYSSPQNGSTNQPIKQNLKKKPNEKYLCEFQFSVGVKVKASNHLAFTLEPSYLLDIKNLNRLENTNNFTLNTGFLYTF